LSNTSKVQLDDPNMADASEPNIPETEPYNPQDGTTLTGDLIMERGGGEGPGPFTWRVWLPHFC
jgi:hypothetical protein